MDLKIDAEDTDKREDDRHDKMDDSADKYGSGEENDENVGTTMK